MRQQQSAVATVLTSSCCLLQGSPENGLHGIKMFSHYRKWWMFKLFWRRASGIIIIIIMIQETHQNITVCLLWDETITGPVYFDYITWLYYIEQHGYTIQQAALWEWRIFQLNEVAKSSWFQRQQNRTAHIWECSVEDTLRGQGKQEALVKHEIAGNWGTKRKNKTKQKIPMLMLMHIIGIYFQSIWHYKNNVFWMSIQPASLKGK